MVTAAKSRPPVPAGPEVEQLLELHGIVRNFINYAGEHQEISPADRLEVLGLMGVNVDCDSDVEQMLAESREQSLGHWLPTATIVSSEDPVGVELRLLQHELDTRFSWTLDTETGEHFDGTFLPADLEQAGQFDSSHGAGSVRRLALPDLPPGYHRLTLSGPEKRDFQLIAAPRHCFQPDWLTAGRKLAGISLHLYELPSSRNWGIGDFHDLRTFVQRSADAGLDFIVLNPLHILDSLAPRNCSPYSPVDRRFLNPLYIDVETEPDFADNDELRAYVDRPAFQSRLAQLRESALVDYDSVNHLKLTALVKMFKFFQARHLHPLSLRGQAFQQWVASRGEVLMRFGEFQAQRHRLSLPVARLPEFHCYLQWLAEAQLEACQAEARERGMAIGLVRDIAVGSDRSGAEVSLNPSLFCTTASVGAPPDPFAPQGQNWGLPPMKPLALKQTGFAHFIELIRDNMRHCGALRIDHIMSLMRLWWCPEPPGEEPQGASDSLKQNTDEHAGSSSGTGSSSGKGAYVSYPAEELFAILRLESQRQQCLVIGEDLGVVPPEIRHLMGDSSVFSNLLFYFEKYDALHFRHPRDWKPTSLAMVANHDVPTLAAWWSKQDLALRSEIGLIADQDSLNAAISARESDLIQILHWLKGLHLLPDNWQDFNIHRDFDDNLCRAILRANAMSASLLVSLQPEDLCRVEKPINIPGTSKEYPNWQRKLPVTVEQLFSGHSQKLMIDEFVAARATP